MIGAGVLDRRVGVGSASVEPDRQHGFKTAASKQERRLILRRQLQFVQRKMLSLLEEVFDRIPESSGITPLEAMLPEERRRYEALGKMQARLLARM